MLCLGRDPEPPALLIVEDSGEDAGRVKTRETEPVNRAVHAHERGGMHVADDAVVLNGLVSQVPTLRLLTFEIIIASKSGKNSSALFCKD